MRNIIALAALGSLLMLNAQAATAAQGSKGRVLLVASSTDTLVLKDGRTHPTGFFLDELYVPAQRLLDEGYDVVVATPKGNKPVVDKVSVKVSMFDSKEELERAVKFVDTFPSMQKPLTLKEAEQDADKFVAVYVPGGHAPMNDLMQDPDLGKIIRRFHAEGKPTAFLCHGPIATLAALPMAKEYRAALVEGSAQKLQEYRRDWIYAGYRMTIYSNDEEYSVEKNVLHGQVPFYVADVH